MKNAEEQFQKAVKQYLDHLHLFWWHTPNGGLRNIRVAQKLKAQGVKPGVPDCLILEPWVLPTELKLDKGWYTAHNDRGINIALELKIWPNKPTTLQNNFLWELTARGWLCAVCYDLKEVEKICQCLA